MPHLSGDALKRQWRLAAVVLACLLALGLPYLIIQDLAERGPVANGPLPATPLPTSGAPSAGAGAAATAAATTSAATTAVAPSTALADATDACRLASLRLSTSLAAATVSLAQFDKHIDAMNLLVAGRISYAVATQFWEETRVGASQNAAAFRRSERAVAASRSTCARLPATVTEDLPYGEVVRLNECVGYVSAGTAALRRASTAVETWNHHIHDMEMLRAGDITAAQATAAWTKSWRTGEKQLKAFETAHERATSAPCRLT